MEAFRGAVKPVEAALPLSRIEAGSAINLSVVADGNRVQTAMRERPRLRRVLITRRPV